MNNILEESVDIILLRIVQGELFKCYASLAGAQNILSCDLFGNAVDRKNYAISIAPIKKLLSVLTKDIENCIERGGIK